MTQAIQALLNSVLPTALATKGLSKINPTLSDFLVGALSAGYTAEQAMGYLRDTFESKSFASTRKRLEQGEEEGSLRPDEAAALSRIRRSQEIPAAVGKAAVLGAGLMGGRAAAGMPKIPGGQPSPLIPAPRGQAAQQLAASAQPQGGPLYTGTPQVNQVPPGQAQFPPMGQVSQGISQQGNPLDLIRQYHPDLGDHIEQYVQQGQSPIAAAALAKRSGYFNDVIKSIEKSEKMNFVDWVADIFGLPKVEGKQIATQGPQAGPAGMRGQAAQPGPTAPQGHPELLRLLGQASQFMANYRGRT